MMIILDGYPDNVLAVRASGRVTAEDYQKVLVPEAEARLKRHDKIRVLYQIDAAFESFSPGAILADAQFGLGHLKHLDRTALVTDETWIVNAAHLFAPFFHMPFRTFANADFDQARDWVLDQEIST